MLNPCRRVDGTWAHVARCETPAFCEATENDRLYFELYPDRKQYVRPVHPGEVEETAAKCRIPIPALPPTHVKVTQLGPGLRIRELIRVALNDGT